MWLVVVALAYIRGSPIMVETVFPWCISPNSADRARPRGPCTRRSKLAMDEDAESLARARAELLQRDLEHLKLPDDQFKVCLSL